VCDFPSGMRGGEEGQDEMAAEEDEVLDDGPGWPFCIRYAANCGRMMRQSGAALPACRIALPSMIAPPHPTLVSSLSPSFFRASPAAAVVLFMAILLIRLSSDWMAVMAGGLAGRLQPAVDKQADGQCDITNGCLDGREQGMEGGRESQRCVAPSRSRVSAGSTTTAERTAAQCRLCPLGLI
jgi:hypothetical protein